MKKIFFGVTILSGLSFSAQKTQFDILKSNNIKEIETFLKDAHPNDHRRTILKPKLIALKNSSLSKRDGASYKNLKPLVIVIPKSKMKQSHEEEAEEFESLLAANSQNHQGKTVKLLNQLFDNDISNQEAILLLQNNSDCNMIVRIQGEDLYNLAVPAHGENSVVIKKGDYQLSSKVCTAQYSSTKKIVKNMLVTLNKPVVSFQNETITQN